MRCAPLIHAPLVFIQPISARADFIAAFRVFIIDDQKIILSFCIEQAQIEVVCGFFDGLQPSIIPKRFGCTTASKSQKQQRQKSGDTSGLHFHGKNFGCRKMRLRVGRANFNSPNTRAGSRECQPSAGFGNRPAGFARGFQVSINHFFRVSQRRDARRAVGDEFRKFWHFGQKTAVGFTPVNHDFVF